MRCKQLAVSHAFHSSLMEPILDKFEREVERVTLHRPTVPLIANVTGRLAGDEITRTDYWRQQIRQPVRFSQSMQTLLERNCDVFVEIGPHPSLSSMAKSSVDEGWGTWVSSLRRNNDDWEVLLGGLARLYTRGVSVDWQRFEEPYGHRRIGLSTYAFQRQRYWAVSSAWTGHLATDGLVATGDREQPIYGRLLESPGKEKHYISDVGVTGQPYLASHVIYDQVVVPGAYFVASMLTADANEQGVAATALEDIVMPSALVLEQDAKDRRVHLVMKGTHDDLRPGTLELFSQSSDADTEGGQRWTNHARAVHSQPQTQWHDIPGLEHVQDQCRGEIPVAEVWQSLSERGLELGADFRWAKRLYQGDNQAIALLQRPSGTLASDAVIHPVLLDACFRVMAAALPSGDQPRVYVPFAIDRIEVRGQCPDTVWCHASWQSPRDGGDDEIWNGSLTIFDTAGKPVVRVQGFRGKRLRRADLQALQKRPWARWTYEVTWREERLADQDLRDDGLHG
ncbi:MAG: polyketide synthase dehydratase domain-containing protein, partial [Myxococcota bacterium]